MVNSQICHCLFGALMKHVFVSWSFQIQLEKIRASENEVRWQHEEDVDDCANCKQTFTVTRRKVC